MRRAVVLALLWCAACSDTAEVAAWRARKAALTGEVAALRTLDADRPAAQARWAVVQPKWAALQRQLDVVALARASDAGVRAFQDERGVSLAFAGTLEGCRDALTALGDVRKLTRRWQLRIDPDGACRWQALETPAVRELHLMDAPARWAPPPGELGSFGVGGLRDDVKRLEAERQQLQAALGALALLPELDARLTRGEDVLDAVTRSPAPCDLALVTRALELGDRGLLEASAEALVHPLAPEDDARTKGLATRLPNGPLVWNCER